MRRASALLYCLTLVHPAYSDEAAEKPTLVLDAGGHTDFVRKVLIKPDGRELISVSNDKSVRVWDVASGDVLRVLRPPAGEGLNGGIFAASLSPDGRTLAVGGYGFEGEPKSIYLISLATGRIEKVVTVPIGALAFPVSSLAFAPDGRRLASGGGDGVIRIWDVNTGRCEHVLEGHTATVTGIAYSPDGRRLATASIDKSGRVWSADTGKAEATLRGHQKELLCVAWRPDGRTIATGGLDNSVRLWGPGGQSFRGFEGLPDPVSSLAFTPDSRELIATLAGESGRGNVAVLDLASGKQRFSFTGHGNSAFACDVSPDGALVASAGGVDNEIFLWKTADGTVVRRCAGKGRGVCSVGWTQDGRFVAWGNTAPQPPVLDAEGPIEKSFNPSELELSPPTGQSIVRAGSRLGDVSVKRVDRTTLSVERPGEAAVTVKTAHALEEIACFTLLPGDRVAVGTYRLTIFDTKTGRPVRTLQGHTGPVWAVAPSPDGRLLASASSDQTVRVWDPNRDEPLLSLFAAGDDWVAWTPEGYYAASPGGEKLMGWRVGNGKEALASFYPADKFRKTLYRPDVIRLVLSNGGTDRAIEVADRARGRASEKVEVADVLPPVVEITSPARSGKTVESPRLTVKVLARSRGGYAVKSLRLLLDGRPYLGQKGVNVVDTPRLGEVAVSWAVDLEPGTHKLAVQAETEKSQGVSDVVEVTYAPEQDVVLPTLYVLAVGVSAYPGDLRLHYAAGDAEAVDGAFRKASGALFKAVEVRRLTDAGARRADILEGLIWLRRQMTQKDVGVFFFSGHGMRDTEGSLYLLPVDAEPEKLLSTAVADDQLKKALGGMPGRVIAMLDACHAGAAGGDRRKAAQGLTDDLVRDLVTDDYGVVVMASSTGREFSLENNAKRQSNFTLAVVEGLSGSADYNKDKVVYLGELDNYVSDRVKELSKGLQHPVTAKPTSVRSFPLSKP